MNWIMQFKERRHIFTNIKDTQITKYYKASLANSKVDWWRFLKRVSTSTSISKFGKCVLFCTKFDIHCSLFVKTRFVGNIFKRTRTGAKPRPMAFK